MATMRIGSGTSSRRSNAPSDDTAVMVFSRGEIHNSTVLWRRSARSKAVSRNATIESEAERRRSVSRPDAMLGNAIAAMIAISTITIIISSSVTPRDFLFVIPADAIGIIPVAARLPVGPETDYVRFIAVIAGIFVLIRMSPGIHGDVLRQVWPRPLLHALGLNAQSLQSLLGRRINSGVELVGAERGHERVHLSMRLRPPRRIR